MSELAIITTHLHDAEGVVDRLLEAGAAQEQLGILVGPGHESTDPFAMRFALSHRIQVSDLGRCILYGRPLSEQLLAGQESFRDLLYRRGFQDEAALAAQRALEDGRTLVFVPRAVLDATGARIALERRDDVEVLTRDLGLEEPAPEREAAERIDRRTEKAARGGTMFIDGS